MVEEKKQRMPPGQDPTYLSFLLVKENIKQLKSFCKCVSREQGPISSWLSNSAAASMQGMHALEDARVKYA